MVEKLQEEDSFGQDQRLKFAVFGLFFAGLFLLAVGAGIFLFRGSASGDDIQIISADSQSQQAGKIVVHVDGAVEKPGVYELSSDSRVSDAVSAAGNLQKDADMARINLAAKLADGQKVYIPKIAEGVKGTASTIGITGTTSGLININTATESQLDTLPGVGPVTAQKIIASRPYSSPEDLLTKKAVGQSTFGKIKDLITAY